MYLHLRNTIIIKLLLLHQNTKSGQIFHEEQLSITYLLHNLRIFQQIFADKCKLTFVTQYRHPTPGLSLKEND